MIIHIQAALYLVTTINKKVLHVVAASDMEMLYIITVCYPDRKKFMDDLRTRR